MNGSADWLMSILKFSIGLSIKFHIVFALVCVCSAVTCAQVEKKSDPAAQSPEITQDDVIRVNTDVIQTGVAVFDKKGQFVNNLKPEDFDLLVDGKPVSISFFEENKSRRSGIDQPKANQTSAGPETIISAPAKSAARGRNILFVVDDFHLSMESHARVRKLISKFIDQEMTAEDTVAVVSPSGKIGFLQQFTNDKAVLRAAVARLIFSRDRSANDPRPPPMSEYEALLISQFDSQVTDIFAAAEDGADMESKRNMVRLRARMVLTQVANINRGTYAVLEQAIRSSARLAGRKVVFFLSDGFLLDPSNSDSSYRMRRITDAAARTNAVVYSFDAKGLEAGFPEGTTGSSPMIGYRVQSGERLEKQDGLNLVARETGGRFIRNQNNLQPGLTQSIDEATQFYLLAWQAVSEDGKSEKLRKIEVRLRNHPELRVRAQSGYLDKKFVAAADEKSKPDKKSKTPQRTLSVPDQQLDDAANALVTDAGLPVALTAVYLDVPNQGMLAYITSQIKSEAVEFSPENGEKAQANIDILGLVYDSNGKREGFFREVLTVDASRSELSKSERRDVYHDYQIKLKPGLHQIRVAVRDAKSGALGSAIRWIEIPDLTTRKLALSSLILNERVTRNQNKRANILVSMGMPDLRIMADRRISRTSDLRYMIFAYNAARGEAGTGRPDVTIQTQILRGDDIVLTTATSSISTEGQDPARLAYAAEIPLAGLPPGRYDLLVLIQDRIAKSKSTQRVSFEAR